ncbi:MAG: uracil-DNA glycosylase [Clostridia bacterium]|nr:uracil-DNA glycosylase [Clostridia bacterium]
MVHLGNDWDEILRSEFESEYYLSLREFLKYEYSHFRIYPPMNDIFNALRYTSYADTRVVILGQDPYHGEGQAHGLCFSVKDGTPPPPSLKNIFKELESDLGIKPPKNPELTGWARQGVLLLNTTLTVREASPQSHKGHGWETFTDRVISLLSEREEPIVFILWGGNARAKKSLIDTKRHCIIESAHPSPLSAYNGFFGSRPFSRANDFLRSIGRNAIDFTIFN